jgi:O-antigen/teichoic acid export membrane protein
VNIGINGNGNTGWFNIRELYSLPLFYNAWYLLGVMVVPAVFGFLFWAIASRLYPAEAVGQGSALIAAATLVSWMAGLGTNIGLIRFLPETVEKRRLINSVINLNFLLSLFLGVIFWAGIPLWAGGLRSVQSNFLLLIIFFLLLIACTIGTTIRDCFVGLQKAVYSFWYIIIANVTRILVIITGTAFGAAGLLASVGLGQLAANLVGDFRFLSKLLPRTGYNLQLHWGEIRRIIPFSSANYISSLINQASNTLIPIMTLNVVGSKGSAYAYIAMMIGFLLLSPGLSLATSVFASGSNDPSQAAAQMKKAIAVSFAVTLTGSILCFALAPELLALFGPEYAREGVSLLRWMVIGAPFHLVLQFYSSLLRIRKQILWLVILNGIYLAILLVIVGWGLPVMGINANGVGFTAGNITIAGIILLILWRDHARRRV